jgi:hypothetical protein
LDTAEGDSSFTTGQPSIHSTLSSSTFRADGSERQAVVGELNAVNTEKTAPKEVFFAVVFYVIGVDGVLTL